MLSDVKDLDMKTVFLQMRELIDYLDSIGYVLMITKKSRSYKRRTIVRPELIPLEKRTYGRTNVRERRLQMGLSGRKLAEKVGVSNVIVMRMEDPTLRHKYSSMKRFADFFGCEVDDLVEKEENVE